MVRTIVTLPEDMKIWLDNYSKKHSRPSAETIREAIKIFKQIVESNDDDTLTTTAGIWQKRGIDSKKFVQSLRDEWSRVEKS